jgi:hypothetical protein
MRFSRSKDRGGKRTKIMANNNPLSNMSALFGGNTGGPATRDQVVAGTVQGLTGIGGGTGGSSQNNALTAQLTSLTQQLQQLQTINQTQIDTLQENTQALSQSTSSKGQGSVASTASSVGSTLLDVFGLGSGLSPLISGLTSLFGGGGSSQPSLTPYVAPLRVDAVGGFGGSSAGGAFAVDNGDGGLPRPAPSPGGSGAAAQITVQVQAMDSQSFLDHSNDIALAVRQAMLQSSVLSDVIQGV